MVDLKETYSRLLKKESGTIFKPHGGKIKIALVYPNTYHVGMSNLGFQFMYKLLNSYTHVVCERVFLPALEIRRELERTQRPLLTIESGLELNRFDLLAFSVSFESDYANVPVVLRLGKIPPFASERNDYHPLVIAGGAATFLNPEPMVDFFDAIAIGEGELLVPPLMEALGEFTDKEAFLDRLSRHRGFYIPPYYNIEYNTDGRLASITYTRPNTAAPNEALVVGPQEQSILRQAIEPLPATTFKMLPVLSDAGGAAQREVTMNDWRSFPPVHRLRFAPEEATLLPSTTVFTEDTEMSNKLLVEISRGCPLGCRFCWAGFSYIPYREFSSKLILEAAEKARPITSQIGLVATAVCDHSDFPHMLSELRKMDYKISVSSLRLDHISPYLLDALVESHTQTITIAPEVGSDRLRRVINKTVTNEEIYEKARLIFSKGLLNLKCYFMVGLPTETNEDVDAIADMALRLRALMIEEERRFGRLGYLIVSVSCFVPKPNTPFQWLPVEDEKPLKAKLKRLEDTLCSVSNVKLRAESPRYTSLDALLSLGDRRLSKFLVALNGDISGWKQALRDTGTDLNFYVKRTRDTDELLPWDIVDNGMDKRFLALELKKAKTEKTTEPCPSVPTCSRCGICEDDAPTNLIQRPTGQAGQAGFSV